MTGPARRRTFGLIVVVFSCLATLAVAEGVLRLLERLQRPEQRRRARVEEAYQARAFRKGGLGPAGFLAEGFRGMVSDEHGQPVEWVHNSAGFRSRREFAREPPPGTLRILIVGDSFVAGHRVGQDETFGAILERRLRDSGTYRDVEVLLAATEEPTTGLFYLERWGLAWKPDLVILGLTLGNDIAQVYFNLGPTAEYRFSDRPGAPVLEANPAFDRASRMPLVQQTLLPRECWKPGSGHEPEWVFRSQGHRKGSLYLVEFFQTWLAERRESRTPQPILSSWFAYRDPRLFDGNGLGMYLEPPPPKIALAYHRLLLVLRGYRDLCQKHGVACATAVFPQRFQVQPGDWQATVETYGLVPVCFDLQAPNRRISGYCRRLGLPLLDPTGAMTARAAASGENLYMPQGDMHWNRAGQRAFAEAVLPDLVKIVGGLKTGPKRPAGNPPASSAR